jgi:alanine racemase
VVKADAYGVGACEVSQALYEVGCRDFYLATLDEAAALRLLLPYDVNLYVLGGVPPGCEDQFVGLRLIPILYTLEGIVTWSACCAQHLKPLPCVIKLDTGMTRLGLSAEDFEKLLILAPQLQYFKPALFMSHLSCAEDPMHPLNSQQLYRFNLAASQIKTIFPSIKLSLANSSGTFLGEAFHFDMVRVGAALYGINPQPISVNPLEPVIALKLPILQRRELVEMTAVGYGADALAGANRCLAVVAGGYADGLQNTLGLVPQGQINGVAVNALGRMSMDSCIFDVTHIGAEAEYIEVINQVLTLDFLMQKNTSLGYEVLTSLGRRFRRRYVYSGCIDGTQ